MTLVLKSFVAGRFVEGGGRVALHDPTTEEVIAEAGTEGLDFRGAVEHARSVGGPALRALSFAERGALLGAAASALHEHRDELIELALRNGGNTRSDAKFDLDGCTGTLASYAELGKSLGDAQFLIDGEPVRLARSPRYVGRHVLLPKPGVAVHVNAFNFPAWGFGEKAAVALLAGMPVVTKPATATALVAERMIQILAGAQVFPDGALSFIAGSVGDLFDHLTPQDVVAFTGSAATGARIRARPDFIAKNIRLNVEADSLNAAVLGPDVVPGTATFDVFVRECCRDVTQKAGQKCTAIRRVFVPKERLSAVREAFIEEIARTKVGHPGLKEVRMGPVATASQRADVRAGIAKLSRTAKPVLGDGGRGTLVGIEGGQGYFVAPVVLEAADARAATDVHEHEVFGPCTTLLPYSGEASEAAALVALGQGSLVSSAYSDDRDFLAALVLAAAPWNGRMNLGSEKVAEHSLGPGTVLPSLVHGGPGRAGGGEELGGLRGMMLYLQRTALQGDEPVLARILAQGRTCPDAAGPREAGR